MTPESLRDEALELFLNEAYAKFNAGQAEHGGMLTDRDCHMEMMKESIDFWFYWYGETVRRNNRERYISELEAENARLRALLDFSGGNNMVVESQGNPCERDQG